ncbi:MAG: choice-of-anchor tandem repeat GloVer-containing protein [Bryobacteraceae bacterium]|jgi:uncharacterized repeat protein (TIGR03803 family)
MTKTRPAALAILAAIYMTMANGTPAAQAQTFKVLHTFGGPGDGGIPYGGLVRDSTGNLYGTTQLGGVAGSNCINGCGVVFKVDKTGNETILYSFTGGTDGGSPVAGLLQDSAGNLYGTTLLGGSTVNCGSGCGVVFKLDTAGNQTVLHTFLGSGSRAADGAQPEGVLIEDAKGNLYGTTAIGGENGGGTVFKLSTTGKETVFSFGNDAQQPTNLGEQPLAGVIRDTQGNLYGTSAGGTNSSTPPTGSGVVYKLSEAELAGNSEGTILHIFTGFTGTVPDGSVPYYGSLLRDSAGNLYGTTYVGGIVGNCPAGAGCGTIFKLDAAGAETILYNFTGGADGGYPAAGLIRDSAGNLYGTGILGGTSNAGVVFKLDTAGTLTVLHNFTGGADGGAPLGDLVRDSAGNLYGTTSASGGCGQCGVVFKIRP